MWCRLQACASRVHHPELLPSHSEPQVHDGLVPLLLDISDWLDLPLIWIYLAVCVAALRGVTSGVMQAMLPRALVADGGGNAPIRVSTDGKAGYISTTGDAALKLNTPFA